MRPWDGGDRVGGIGTMAQLYLSLMMSLLTFVRTPTHQESQMNMKIDAPVASVYAIDGILGAQSPQIIVETKLKASCHKLGPSMIRKSPERNVVLFYVEGEKTAEPCSEENLVKIFDLEDLEAGSYEIRDYKNLKKWVSVRVAKNSLEAQSTPRSVLAKVDSFHVSKDELGFMRMVKVSGQLPEGCYPLQVDLENPKVRKLSGNVIEVMPTVESTGTASGLSCRNPKRTKEYERKIELPSEIPSGRYLFRVPSAGGQVIHRIAAVENDVRKVTVRESAVDHPSSRSEL